MDWLLAGDPAIRWQVLRDLAAASPAAVERERQRVAQQGWGARLLALQDPDGTWAKGLYSPKWKSTTYSMLTLRDLGLATGNRQAQRACGLLLDRGLCRDGGIGYGWKISETCVTGIVLSILAHFRYRDPRLDAVADYLIREQLPDGGWNCQRHAGATHASVHTTILVLEGLRLHQQHRGDGPRDIDGAMARGREFLLAHRLFRSHRTGEVIKPVFLKLAYPPRWHYDILRALDHFQAVRAPRDERLGEAVAILAGKRRADGRWNLEHRFRAPTFFEMERVGAPSRWNTLRALRVLRWWESTPAA